MRETDRSCQKLKLEQNNQTPNVGWQLQQLAGIHTSFFFQLCSLVAIHFLKQLLDFTHNLQNMPKLYRQYRRWSFLSSLKSEKRH